MLPLIFWIALMTAPQAPGFGRDFLSIPRELFDSYGQYAHPEITSRKFTQSDLLRWLQPLSARGAFVISPIGQSAEGRTVFLLTAGSGPVKVLLWSQMHGDEPTATMAIVDMMSFFAHAPDHPVVTALRTKLTLLVVPMLNPDGAERFQRRTAQLIDLNRDARRFDTPEARILRTVVETYRPQFGFNLHDQDPRNSVGTTRKVTAIALLAPAFDEERSDNSVRLPAKRVAAVLASTMNLFISGHVAKYDDTFEPRAFGDNIQQWGTSTVLLESGGWTNDREKMFLRKLNYVGLLTALHAIATGEHENADLQAYESLPFNAKYVYDIILRNALLRASDRVPAIVTDIGINIDEQVDERSGTRVPVAKVMDVGDLSVFTAFEEIDLRGAPVESSVIGIEKPIPPGVLEALRRRK